MIGSQIDPGFSCCAYVPASTTRLSVPWRQDLGGNRFRPPMAGSVHCRSTLGIATSTAPALVSTSRLRW